MNVLSLFDGMGCGMIALKELGIKVDKYYASEIDKYAIQQTTLNFPDIVHLGSVTTVDVSKLEPINLLLGGSPCQSFSFAGKRKGMSTKCEIEITRLEQYLELKSQGFEFEGQSYLFWEYMRILTDIRKYNPDVKFLLENVEMGAKWERVLSEAIGVFGVHINSNLVSAQNREGIYWTNIRVKQVGLFSELHSDISQPKDRGVFLKDIRESEVDEKYFISQNVLNRIKRKTYSSPKINPDKTGTINTKNNSGQMSIDSGTTFISVVNNRGNLQETEKINCIDANYWKGMDNHAQRSMVLIGNIYDNGHNCVAGRVYTDDGKSVTLSALGGGGGAKTGLYNMDSRIRRLTPTECARLQTIPEWYQWNVSDTQQYKLLGNGWTVEVIKHILSFLNL